MTQKRVNRGTKEIKAMMAEDADCWKFTDLWVRRPSAPHCSVRGAARFARRTTVLSRHEQRTYESLGPKIEVRAYASVELVEHGKNWRGICGRWTSRLSGRTLARFKARLPAPKASHLRFRSRAFYVAMQLAELPSGERGF
jgi:hypothetical protein